MQQMDMFDKSQQFYLLEQIEKLSSSLDRRTNALFSLMGELNNKIIDMEKKRIANEESMP